MEKSAYEALMLGVNLFIFVVALTAGIMLMGSILDMVNYANENAKIGMNGTLAETVGVVQDRVYSGEQVLAYYRKIINEGSESKYSFKIKFSDSDEPKKLENSIETKWLDRNFELQYEGKTGDKDTYVFVLKQD